MNTTRHLSQEDLALFALQLLENDELAQALDHLEQCEGCRHDVARYQGDLVGYALAMSDVHSPPAAARDRLLKAVAKEKKIVPEAAPPLRRSSAAVPIAQSPLSGELPRLADDAPVTDSRSEQRVADGELFLAARGRSSMFDPDLRDDEERGRRRSAGNASSMLAWAGWAVAAGLAVVAGLQFHERENLQNDVNAQSARLAQANSNLQQAESALQTLTDAGAMQVALHVPVNGQPEPPKPEGHAAYDAQRGALVFIADHLQPLQPYKTYELWLLQPDQKAPVPVGTFKPDARGIATIILPELPKGLAAQGFGVTVEDDGGSKTPTPPIVLAGM